MTATEISIIERQTATWQHYFELERQGTCPWCNNPLKPERLAAREGRP